MARILLQALLQVGIILPFAFILLEHKNRTNFTRLFLFVLIFLIYTFLNYLPISIDFSLINNTTWNWEGKILSILWGISAFLLFKKYFYKHNYLTLKQNRKGSKQALIGGSAIVILSCILFYLMGEKTFDEETLAFQLLMPGLSEEIMFRGVLLGLLMSSLRGKFYFLGNPSVLLTAVLFGLGHGLQFNASYEVSFDAIYFLYTGIAGYVWAWITVKSGSVLFAILSHSLAAFFGSLIPMIK